MAAGSQDEGSPRLATADPVRALKAVLALRPGSERVKSKTRRTAAAQAMGLLSGDGWRAHHEKALLADLAAVICGLDIGVPAMANTRSVPGPSGRQPGIVRCYGDFVDIADDWESLFAVPSTLDAYALGISPEDFRRKVSEAVEDFRTIGPPHHVEIYLTTAIFRHAIYLFAHQAVLALYALCGDRIPTPALLASEGSLLSFHAAGFRQATGTKRPHFLTGLKGGPWTSSGPILP
ncbi:MAG TPA: hypothetical protein VFQ44_23475 [Streptosporangiaceae bacterium]|nr:hypothetical protein [Streptosporangiaceae bacterium]